MARTPAQSRIDEIIRQAITPELRARGFRKSGRTFRRSAGQAVAVLNVQSDKWNTADAGRFTINLGVFFPAVHAAMSPGWQPSPEGPKEYECTLHARIGELLPGGKDKWWEVRQRDDPRRVIQEVNDAVKRFAIPWLDATSDFDIARAKADGALAVAFALAAGDREGGLRMLRELVQEATLNGRPTAASLSAWQEQIEKRPP